MCSVFGQQWSSEEEEDPSQALINIKPADMISSSKQYHQIYNSRVQQHGLLVKDVCYCVLFLGWPRTSSSLQPHRPPLFEYQGLYSVFV